MLGLQTICVMLGLDPGICKLRNSTYSINACLVVLFVSRGFLFMKVKKAVSGVVLFLMCVATLLANPFKIDEANYQQLIEKRRQGHFSAPLVFYYSSRRGGLRPGCAGGGRHGPGLFSQNLILP